MGGNQSTLIGLGHGIFFVIDQRTSMPANLIDQLMVDFDLMDFNNGF